MKPEIRSFVSVLRSPVTQPFDRGKTKGANRLRRMGTVSKSATFLATECVNPAPFKRGEAKVQIFGKEKCKTHRKFQRY